MLVCYLKSMKFLYMKYLLLYVGCLLSLSSCSTSYYYIVRHGERLNDSKDSPLSTAGQQRAQTLKDSLSDKDIQLIYASRYVRTQQTVQPLADVLHIPMVIYNQGNTDSMVAVFNKVRNKKVLIAGHSDTVPDIVKGISGQTVPEMKPTDFDNLYVIKKRHGLFANTQLWHYTYGTGTQ